MPRPKLASVLAKHQKWCDALPGGRQADLRGADLTHAAIPGVNLVGARLSGANLRNADLRGADLRGADLQDAQFSGANLRGAKFGKHCDDVTRADNADFTEAVLARAILADAVFAEARFRGANLARADLRNASFRGADLTDAYLIGAMLAGADFYGTNLNAARLPDTPDGSMCRLDFGRWSVYINATKTAIGCQQHSNAEWLSWSSKSPEIAAMHAEAPEWWAAYGPAVKAAIRSVVSQAKKRAKRAQHGREDDE